jgi:hypothetical protein
MARGSVWIRSRPTKAGGVRHRVEYRLGGREAPTLFGGSFGTKREASIRKVWILEEIAAGRAPKLNLLTSERPKALTLARAGQHWFASRIDIADSTKTRHGLELSRIDRVLGAHAVDEVTSVDVVDFVATQVPDYSRGTIRPCRRSRWCSTTQGSTRTRPATSP